MTASEMYAFDRSLAETRRLQLQGRIYASHTRHLLRRAGIKAGMRVLDVGCGAGDVTLAIAELVGPTGSVLGVDADADVLDEAGRRAVAEGAHNVTFARATLPHVQLDEPVDALVGRLIVTHLPDRVDTVREMARLVRPGGVVTFQDLIVTRTRSAPAVPLVTRAVRLIVAALRVAGADADTGRGLPAILKEAGLAYLGSETRRVSASDPDSEEFLRACEHVVLTVASLRPVILQAGLATAEELDTVTMNARMRQELISAEAVLYSPELVGAWARVPD